MYILYILNYYTYTRLWDWEFLDVLGTTTISSQWCWMFPLSLSGWGYWGRTVPHPLSVHCHLHLCPGLGSNHRVSSHNGLTNPLFLPCEMEWYTASLISIKCQVCFSQRILTSSERPRKVQQLANSVTAFPGLFHQETPVQWSWKLLCESKLHADTAGVQFHL